MKKIIRNAFFIALILFFSVSSQSAALEIGGKVHTVKEGETLLDIAQTDEVMVLAIKILNDIENPLELKVGSKIILPDASFVTEILALPVEEIEERAEEYRDRISSTLLAELNASYIDPEVLKGMGNLAELPKPADVNPGFFQGVMPAFKPMYGFIGASLDQSLAALEETWNSPQNASNDFFKTTLGNMPKSSQRVVATTVALSTSGKIPATTSSSSSRSTKSSTSSTGKRTTASAATKTSSSKADLTEIAAGKADAALTSAQSKLAESVKQAADKVIKNAKESASNIGGATASGSASVGKTSTASATKTSSSSSSSSSSTDWGAVAGGIAGAAAGTLVGGVAGGVAGALAGSKLGSGGTAGAIASKVANTAKSALDKVKSWF